MLVNGQIAGEAYAPGVTAQTRTHSNSMHKTVVAMMMGAALADGVIKSPDDPIGNYIPALKDDPRGKITLRELLSMASGLKNPSMAKMESAAFEMMLGNVSQAALSLPHRDRAGPVQLQQRQFPAGRDCAGLCVASRRQGPLCRIPLAKSLVPAGQPRGSAVARVRRWKPALFRLSRRVVARLGAGRRVAAPQGRMGRPATDPGRLDRRDHRAFAWQSQLWHGACGAARPGPGSGAIPRKSR